MNLFTELRTLMLATPGITALVGGTGTGARIWNSWPRTYTTPCIVIDIDQEDLQNDLTGHSSLTIAQITITCRGDSHMASDAVSDEVKVLAGYGNGDSEFQMVWDSIVHAEVPKDDGSTAHWYDHVMDGVAIWPEAV